MSASDYTPYVDLRSSECQIRLSAPKSDRFRRMKSEENVRCVAMRRQNERGGVGEQPTPPYPLWVMRGGRGEPFTGTCTNEGEGRGQKRTRGRDRGAHRFVRSSFLASVIDCMSGLGARPVLHTSRPKCTKSKANPRGHSQLERGYDARGRDDPPSPSSVTNIRPCR